MNCSVLLLLGLNTLPKFEVLICFEKETMHSKLDGWKANLKRKRVHLYFRCVTDFFSYRKGIEVSISTLQASFNR